MKGLLLRPGLDGLAFTVKSSSDIKPIACLFTSAKNRLRQERIEIQAQGPQHGVPQLAKRTRWMIQRYSLLPRNICEAPFLNPLVAAHEH
jgi:hypothetical protein